MNQFERGTTFGAAGIESAQQLYDLIEKALAQPGLISEQTQAVGVTGDFILVLQIATGLLRKVTLENLIIPSGVEVPFGGTVAPNGWLLGNGQAVNRISYAALFGIYGVTFGNGDGSTTFNLPDYRGRTAFGKDDMGGTTAQNRITTAGSGLDGTSLGAAGGEEKHILTLPEIPSHSHVYQISGFSQDSNGQGGGGSNRVTSAANSATNTGNSGGGAAHNNMPPAIIRNWIIKT